MLFLKEDISWCDSKYILIEKNVKAVCQELISKQARFQLSTRPNAGHTALLEYILLRIYFKRHNLLACVSIKSCGVVQMFLRAQIISFIH